MPFIDPADLPAGSPLPGWTGRFFHSEHMTFGYWDIEADATPLHEHHHDQEEVWHIVSGRIALTVAGEERILEPGAAAIVPANTPHSARAITPTRAIVVDHPTRPEVGGVRTGAGTDAR